MFFLLPTGENTTLKIAGVSQNGTMMFLSTMPKIVEKRLKERRMDKFTQIRSMMHAVDFLPHGHFIIEFVDGTQREFEHFSEFGAFVMGRERALSAPAPQQPNAVLSKKGTHHG